MARPQTKKVCTQVDVGNVLPIGKMPEGSVVSALEEKPGDRGCVAKTSGTSCIIVGHSDDGKKLCFF